MRLIKIGPLVALSLCFAGKAVSHEFWISPEKFITTPNQEVQANIRVGEKFEGSAYSYNPTSFERFETRMAGETAPVEGRLGDLPAFSQNPSQDGLLTIIYETDNSSLTYSSWEKFVKFAKHKAFPTTLADHDARGIPRDERFTELYRRYAKSLIAVGQPNGTDQEVGLKTEIIALQNPYLIEGTEIEVKVVLDGAPRVNAQVELFEKAPDGSVDVRLFTTDDEGIALLDVKRGHSYLADAVTMLPLENDNPKDGAVWWSLWASLTFAIPEKPLN